MADGATPAGGATDLLDPAAPAETVLAETVLAEDLLVEEISIDGMCGVY